MTAMIFDCDGVLADTERDGHLVAFNSAFAELDLNIRWSAERYAELLKIGGGKERLRVLKDLVDVEPKIPRGDAEFDEFVAELHRRKTRNFVELVRAGALPARPGVARIVEDALTAGWTLAVASTSAEESVRAVLLSAVGDNADRFAGVFAGDIVAAKKPAPDIYLAAVQHLGLDPHDTVVIEDSAVGARASESAGLNTLITVSSFTASEDFTDAAAVVTGLGDDSAPGSVIADRSGQALSTPVTLEALEHIARLRRD